MGLLNREVITGWLTREAPWSSSHGAEDSYLGMGLLYYSLVYARQARVAVCLGSGGGFVPRLMRQAQRDLDIGAVSRTILVDANRPEAGWGSPQWLNEKSFFRSEYPDIEIVIATSQAAISEYFAPQRLNIDYLHIDADHSFEACLADFQSYRPFLSEDSVVTLHDSSYPSAGVRDVVEYLRTRSDCEVIDFPNQGAGTALVRICKGPASHPPVTFGSSTDAVTVTRGVSNPVAPPALGWKYLESPAFQTRSIIAAHFVRDCPTVIELGAGRNSIDRFLGRNWGSVIVLDPLIQEGRQGADANGGQDVWHIRARFQDVKWNIHRPGEYGIVLLGLELRDMSEENFRDLFDLIDHARITVIEFPPSWGPSVEQFAHIRANTRTREKFRCKLDLKENDMGNLEGSWPPRCDREIYVLEPSRTSA